MNIFGRRPHVIQDAGQRDIDCFAPFPPWCRADADLHFSRIRCPAEHKSRVTRLSLASRENAICWRASPFDKRHTFTTLFIAERKSTPCRFIDIRRVLRDPSGGHKRRIMISRHPGVSHSGGNGHHYPVYSLDDQVQVDLDKPQLFEYHGRGNNPWHLLPRIISLHPHISAVDHGLHRRCRHPKVVKGEDTSRSQ